MAERSTETSFYDLLEVSANASSEEIEASYQRITSYMGADALAVYSMLDDGEASRIRESINEAYRTLSDPERRAAYDRSLGASRSPTLSEPSESGYPSVLIPESRSGTNLSVGMVQHRSGADSDPDFEKPSTTHRSSHPISDDRQMSSTGGAASSRMADSHSGSMTLAAPTSVGSTRASAPGLPAQGQQNQAGRSSAAMSASIDDSASRLRVNHEDDKGPVSPSAGGVGRGETALVSSGTIDDSEPDDVRAVRPSTPTGARLANRQSSPRSGGTTASSAAPSAASPRERIVRGPPPRADREAIAAAGGVTKRLRPSKAIDISEDTEFSGTMLRRLRESCPADIDTIAEITKISKRYLSAIEEQEFSILPAPVYVRGFVSEYARILGLDPQRVAQSYMSLYNKYRSGGG